MKELELAVYIKEDGQKGINVQVEGENVWLTQKKMADLFEVSSANITMHLKNIYLEDELDENSTTKDYLVVQKEGNRSVKRNLKNYNLDAILSVGYRISGKKGTHFRRWANDVLKDHLLLGYSVNKKRLLEKEEALLDLKNTLSLFSINNEDKSSGLFEILKRYTKSFIDLHTFDEGSFSNEKMCYKTAIPLMEKEANESILSLKNHLEKNEINVHLFGKNREDGLNTILSGIFQSFGGEDMYKSIEEKASHLLYFIIKNHPFIDGNKRIGAFLFTLFLDKNNYLYHDDGSSKISHEALTSLTILVAMSDPSRKKDMIDLIMHIIN
jgi:prophage maintenance system killer protein